MEQFVADLTIGDVFILIGLSIVVVLAVIAAGLEFFGDWNGNLSDRKS